ncbi:haloacid dehalogenase, type II [Cryptococcus floricola]|uniref:Haloacid dehalogenase, type II n=1 Tax=Cryptococcus floricola TaxID=2591691 RepID=A0A5D3AVQ6_9TREE|nr:haloacid dehalogenase, type II [Cryptococcus floricola]
MERSSSVPFPPDRSTDSRTVPVDDWERGKYEALEESIFSQKTCPEPEKILRSLGVIENRIQQEDKDRIYPEVLELSYKELTAEHRLWYDPASAQAFGDSVGSWPPFPDSAKALKRLKEMGLKLFVLSNVDNESFAVTRKKLEVGGFEFDGVWTAEDIGSYKPDLRNFRYALGKLEEEFGIEPHEVLAVANSKLGDIRPAHKMNLKAVWINRPHAIIGVQGQEDVKPEWEFESMEAFADGVKEAMEEEGY